MRFPLSRLACLIFCAASIAGCSHQSDPARKPTFPVTGKITVDGSAPNSSLRIECSPLSPQGTDSKLFSVSAATSHPDGSFKIATYESGDGAPNGEYALTFVWTDSNPVLARSAGADKLKGRYADPKKSTIKLLVQDKPVDLGVIPLTTK